MHAGYAIQNYYVFIVNVNIHAELANHLNYAFILKNLICVWNVVQKYYVFITLLSIHARPVGLS